MKVVCPSPIGWSKVPCIFLNPGVCPVMRFAFLIPAITALGLAGCQVPPPATTTPVSAPATAQITASVTPDANNASEAGADIVTETDAQNSLDDSTAIQPVDSQSVAVPDAATTDVANPSMASPAMDEVVSTTQESVAETIAPDNGEEEAAPEAEVDAQATVEPKAETTNAPADAPQEDEQAADVGAASDVGPAKTTPRVTSEAGAEPVEPGAEPGTEIADEAPPATTELALAAPSPSPPPPPPPPPPPELAPESLIGLDPAGLQQRLGKADFKRREGPVETWQYRFPTCVVDYFLYPGAANPAVRNWAWRSPVIGGRLDIMACRRALAGRDSAS